MTLTLAHRVMHKSWAGVRYSRMFRHDIILSCRCKEPVQKLGERGKMENWRRGLTCKNSVRGYLKLEGLLYGYFLRDKDLWRKRSCEIGELKIVAGGSMEGGMESKSSLLQVGDFYLNQFVLLA